MDPKSLQSLLIINSLESVWVGGRQNIILQSTLSKTDTFGTGTKCPSYRGVRLIESQTKGVKKGRDQL